VSDRPFNEKRTSMVLKGKEKQTLDQAATCQIKISGELDGNW